MQGVHLADDPTVDRTAEAKQAIRRWLRHFEALSAEETTAHCYAGDCELEHPETCPDDGCHMRMHPCYAGQSAR